MGNGSDEICLFWTNPVISIAAASVTCQQKRESRDSAKTDMRMPQGSWLQTS